MTLPFPAPSGPRMAITGPARHGRPRRATRRLRLPVAMVTPRFPPDLGGVERHVEEVARRLAPVCRLTVLCTDRTGRLKATESRDGYTVRRVRAWPAERDYYFAPGIYRELSG